MKACNNATTGTRVLEWLVEKLATKLLATVANARVSRDPAWTPPVSVMYTIEIK